MSGVSSGKISWMNWDCQKSGAKFMKLLPRKTGDMEAVEDVSEYSEDVSGAIANVWRLHLAADPNGVRRGVARSGSLRSQPS